MCGTEPSSRPGLLACRCSALTIPLSERHPFMIPTRELRPVAVAPVPSELHPAKTSRFCGYQGSN
ncbi:hypothetical protein HaLaN_02222 [Haematococcus lacustris]|uniref:Uncharacterized protein n=1 Tax=Haematococcus lacustris TaxID=44745 RepID=A0A699YB79_HAELA|nr:hypothetical protein HaLaN_02222 [Haematococcus lacustris]